VTVEPLLGALGRVTRRHPYAYATSWPLDDVMLVRPDGSELRVLYKRYDQAPVAKPQFICDPARETEAYMLLAHRALGTPRCYASGRSWLALEKVDGVELWQRGDIAAWEAAARWVARLHREFASRPLAARHLLCHDERFYRRWIAQLPRTLIHGELYASNVLVSGARIAAVDWEMAAIGPGVIDLAALVTGWDSDSRRRIVAAYGEVAQADLAAARLQLALQWLGWAKQWDAPAEHRRDWLAEARDAALDLG
jgi:hypothetical protein